MSEGEGPILDWPAAAAFLGTDYERYSFTKGTAQEVAFLIEKLGLDSLTSVLDVGCGTGRHLAALRSSGVPNVVGVDIAEGFARVVPGPVAAGDARRLPFADASVDVALGLCEGGIGLVSAGEGDVAVVAEIARVLRPGGRAALTVFSAPFLSHHREEGDDFDPVTGRFVESTELRTSTGERRPFRFESVAYTPEELDLLHSAAGLAVEAVWSVGPGDYAARPPDLEHPELLVLASKPLR